MEQKSEISETLESHDLGSSESKVPSHRMESPIPILPLSQTSLSSNEHDVETKVAESSDMAQLRLATRAYSEKNPYDPLKVDMWPTGARFPSTKAIEESGECIQSFQVTVDRMIFEGRTHLLEAHDEATVYSQDPMDMLLQEELGQSQQPLPGQITRYSLPYNARIKAFTDDFFTVFLTDLLHALPPAARPTEHRPPKPPQHKYITLNIRDEPELRAFSRVQSTTRTLAARVTEPTIFHITVDYVGPTVASTTSHSSVVANKRRVVK